MTAASIRCGRLSRRFARGRILAAVLAAVFAAILALLALPARADDRGDLARSTCTALDRAVAAVPGDAVLLPSYRVGPVKAPAVESLRDVAFTYDNALASIALFACGKPASARRIADALVRATTTDPDFHDGRVRNAYAAGPVDGVAIRLPGFWDAERRAWSQDAYQVSFATGNAAWAALALLEAHRRTHDAAYLAAARRVLDWIRREAFDDRAPTAYVGGLFLGPSGFARQNWKSVEQNVDLVAAFAASAASAAISRLSAGDDAARAAVARAFVASQWDATEGRFYIGTGPDGRTSDHDHSGLDAQIWPLIAVADAPSDWMRALAFVDAWHAVDGGYGFNRAPDGVWTEGTAQVASVFVLRGLAKRAVPLWSLLRRQQADDGWLYATPKPRINTGLAIGPASVTNDFFYYHLPHLGATAWTAIAATGVNPFRGR